MLLQLMGVVVGAILAILIAGWFEVKKSPKLQIQIRQPEPVAIVDAAGRVLSQFTILNVEVINRPLSKWLTRLMVRSAASRCRAIITFNSTDGRPLFNSRTMPGRWANSPQPAAASFRFWWKTIQIHDLSINKHVDTMDIFPDHRGEDLNIAAKHGAETSCYGWNNDSYSTKRFGHPPQWELPIGEYLVRVDVKTGGQDLSKTFKLINGSGAEDFKLIDV